MKNNQAKKEKKEKQKYAKSSLRKEEAEEVR
jgi:hypothetical protein